MLDLFDTPQAARGDIQVFSSRMDETFVWKKPRGLSSFHMFAMGRGGDGAAGVVGAPSTAAGGSGGSAARQQTLTGTLMYLPDVLFVNFVSASGQIGTISVDRSTVGNSSVLVARNGGDASASSGVTPGSSTGAASALQSAHTLVGVGRYVFSASSGQNGGSGGVSGVGTSLSLAGAAIITSAGGGGGGLGALSSAGSNGGAVTFAGNAWCPSVPGGIGPTGGSNTAGGRGCSKNSPWNSLVFYGGSGGASQSLGASGAVAGGGDGGNGDYGCGGGGGGAGFTGSTPGLGGKGGPGLVYIICW